LGWPGLASSLGARKMEPVSSLGEGAEPAGVDRAGPESKRLTRTVGEDRVAMRSGGSRRVQAVVRGWRSQGSPNLATMMQLVGDGDRI
jgi:hypothetical protein